jgi:hypothetical protein
MGESKHTPGPWQIKNDYTERHIVIANVDGETFTDGTSSCSYDFVCDTYGDGDDDSRSMAVAIANARLIASAPDLLAALTLCQSALAMMIAPDAIKNTTVLNAFAQANEAEAKSRAALAKAGA